MRTFCMFVALFFSVNVHASFAQSSGFCRKESFDMSKELMDVANGEMKYLDRISAHEKLNNCDKNIIRLVTIDLFDICDLVYRANDLASIYCPPDNCQDVAQVELLTSFGRGLFHRYVGIKCNIYKAIQILRKKGMTTNANRLLGILQALEKYSSSSLSLFATMDSSDCGLADGRFEKNGTAIHQ